MNTTKNTPYREAEEFLAFRAVLDDLRETDRIGLELLKRIVESVATKPTTEADLSALAELLDETIDRRERLIAACEFLEGRA